MYSEHISELIIDHTVVVKTPRTFYWPKSDFSQLSRLRVQAHIFVIGAILTNGNLVNLQKNIFLFKNGYRHLSQKIPNVEFDINALIGQNLMSKLKIRVLIIACK